MFAIPKKDVARSARKSLAGSNPVTTNASFARVRATYKTTSEGG
jgi:hypothetical protein